MVPVTVELAPDLTSRVQGGVDVDIRRVRLDRRHQLVHLPSRDPLTGGADDVGRDACGVPLASGTWSVRPI